MGFPFRVFNWFSLVIAAILEIVALYFLCSLLYSHCVLAGEYALTIWIYLYFLPAITAQTMILALFRACLKTVGLDPIAVAFVLFSGIITVLLTVILLINLLDHCGNEYAYMFYITGGCGLISGLVHLANAVVCIYHMPPEEAQYLKPARRRNKR